MAFVRTVFFCSGAIGLVGALAILATTLAATVSGALLGFVTLLGRSFGEAGGFLGSSACILGIGIAAVLSLVALSVCDFLAGARLERAVRSRSRALSVLVWAHIVVAAVACIAQARLARSPASAVFLGLVVALWFLVRHRLASLQRTIATS